jgi:hypothetical protein
MPARHDPQKAGFAAEIPGHFAGSVVSRGQLLA